MVAILKNRMAPVVAQNDNSDDDDDGGFVDSDDDDEPQDKPKTAPVATPSITPNSDIIDIINIQIEAILQKINKPLDAFVSLKKGIEKAKLNTTKHKEVLTTMGSVKTEVNKVLTDNDEIRPNIDCALKNLDDSITADMEMDMMVNTCYMNITDDDPSFVNSPLSIESILNIVDLGDVNLRKLEITGEINNYKSKMDKIVIKLKSALNCIDINNEINTTTKINFKMDETIIYKTIYDEADVLISLDKSFKEKKIGPIWTIPTIIIVNGVKYILTYEIFCGAAKCVYYYKKETEDKFILVGLFTTNYYLKNSINAPNKAIKDHMEKHKLPSKYEKVNFEDVVYEGVISKAIERKTSIQNYIIKSKIMTFDKIDVGYKNGSLIFMDNGIIDLLEWIDITKYINDYKIDRKTLMMINYNIIMMSIKLYNENLMFVDLKLQNIMFFIDGNITENKFKIKFIDLGSIVPSDLKIPKYFDDIFIQCSKNNSAQLFKNNTHLIDFHNLNKDADQGNNESSYFKRIFYNMNNPSDKYEGFGSVDDDIFKSASKATFQMNIIYFTLNMYVSLVIGENFSGSLNGDFTSKYEDSKNIYGIVPDMDEPNINLFKERVKKIYYIKDDEAHNDKTLVDLIDTFISIGENKDNKSKNDYYNSINNFFDYFVKTIKNEINSDSGEYLCNSSRFLNKIQNKFSSVGKLPFYLCEPYFDKTINLLEEKESMIKEENINSFIDVNYKNYKYIREIGTKCDWSVLHDSVSGIVNIKKEINVIDYNTVITKEIMLYGKFVFDIYDNFAKKQIQKKNKNNTYKTDVIIISDNKDLCDYINKFFNDNKIQSKIHKFEMDKIDNIILLLKKKAKNREVIQLIISNNIVESFMKEIFNKKEEFKEIFKIIEQQNKSIQEGYDKNEFTIYLQKNMSDVIESLRNIIIINGGTITKGGLYNYDNTKKKSGGICNYILPISIFGLFFRKNISLITIILIILIFILTYKFLCVYHSGSKYYHSDKLYIQDKKYLNE